MSKRVLNTYPLATVMSYAVMANAINNGEYIKQTVEKPVEVDGQPTKWVVDTYSNKEIMNVAMDTGFLYKKTKGVGQFKGTEPTAEDVKLAGEIMSYYAGLMFKAIGGKINDFEQNVLELVKRGKLTPREFGIVASLPKSYKRGIERDKIENRQREISDESTYFAKVGETVNIDIEVLRINFISKLNCSVVNAVTGDNNMVVFFTSKDESYFEGKNITVKGRIKRCQVSKFHGGKETVLNYVKRVDK
jgi:hypothetical protein